jgi:hypothetical protein
VTTLSRRKTIMRTRTAARIQGRDLILELHPTRPHELYIRESRRRSGYWVPYIAVYHCGAKIAANEEREAKRGRR